MGGGEPTIKQKNEHEKRFNEIKQFLLQCKERNFFIKHDNFKTPLNDTNENKIYNKLKDIIGSDYENYEIKINQHFGDISKFRLYDDEGEFFMNSPNYIYIITMLANFIDKDSCIHMIHSKSHGFDSINNINSNTHIKNAGIIQYIIDEHNNYLSPIITSFNNGIYIYYLTLDTNIFKRLLTEEEIAAAEAKRRGSARVLPLKRINRSPPPPPP